MPSLKLQAMLTATFLALALPSPTSAADLAGLAPQRVAHDSCRGHAPASNSYSVHTGDDLRSVLVKWSKTAGWTLVWKSSYTFSIAGNASFPIDYVAAVGALMTAMQEARPSPVADAYRENCVLVITDGLSDVR